MMCLWGWKGRNNLQVGEMRHEWLLSLTCAMLLVCVRSRQIPSVLSPFASVMGGWEHQLPPRFLLFFCAGPVSLTPGCCFMEAQGVHVAHLFEGAGVEPGTFVSTSMCHPLNRTWARKPLPLPGRKGVKKWNVWVLWGQLHILPCLPPPDRMHSPILASCPLRTPIAIQVVPLLHWAEWLRNIWPGSEIPAHLWGVTWPLFVTPSFLSEPLYLGSVDFCIENTVEYVE